MNRDGPWLAADAVVFDDSGRVLLVRRKYPPFQGHLALPGGFVEAGETTEAAALRELKEETSIDGSSPRLVGVYSDPKRDPRHHTVSAVYLVTAASYDVQAGDDAADALFVANWEAQILAFDHRQIISDALRVKGR
jgi:8-oxo-dGTP diphosphatase